jgi:hypothetical protein
MALDFVDLLLERTWKGGNWPPRSESKIWSALAAWQAFHESDREALKKVADWQHTDREYKVDGLAARIAEAWADHLFGEELTITPAALAAEAAIAAAAEEAQGDGDEPPEPSTSDGPTPGDVDDELMAALVEENDVTEEARAAESDLVVPEGEAWWRCYVDTEVADVPLLEWHTRQTVIPYFIGRRLKAVALVTVLEGPGRDGDRKAVWRHFEIHVDGRVEHVLARGKKDRIGDTIGLDRHGETAELGRTLASGRNLAAVWDHGLPMLMGRVINKRGRNPRLGVSEFDRIKDNLLDLNEAATIAAENARLTAKKRAIVPANSGALRPTVGPLVDNGEGQLVPASGKPVFDAGEDVLIADPTDAELGKQQSPFQILEYSFDAEALIAHKRDLVETALTRLGMTPVWIGVRTGEGDGAAVSGTHLRLRLIPTDKTGRGKGRAWARELPRALCNLQRLDALAVNAGGFGRAWNDPTSEPTVEFANPLPTDEVEQATTESTLVSAGARSVETSIRNQHPEWSEQQVRDEVDRIKADRPAAPALGFPA